MRKYEKRLQIQMKQKMNLEKSKKRKKKSHHFQFKKVKLKKTLFSICKFRKFNSQKLKNLNLGFP